MLTAGTTTITRGQTSTKLSGEWYTNPQNLWIKARAAPIIRDIFNPIADINSLGIHLWFTWLTEAQYNDFKENGTVPGHKDTRGDSVHKHHRLHNTPDHGINLHIHNSWNAASDNDDYAGNKPIYLLAWKTSIHHILSHSFADAQYFRRAEDVSIEFNPT
eukprot:1331744-Amphidinium_carterae.1